MATIWGRAFAERIVKPIRELVIAAEKVKGGDLSVQVPLVGLKKDEIKVLSSSFNRMVSQIDRQQKDLVVAQRSLAWSDVARRVAHEIKNPLTPIQLSAERLLKKYKCEVSDQESFEKYLNNILRHSNDIKNPQTRKPALTLDQFGSTKKGTKEQINTVLNKYRMTTIQRDELKKLIV